MTDARCRSMGHDLFVEGCRKADERRAYERRVELLREELRQIREEEMSEPDFLKVLVERAEMLEEREATFRKDWEMDEEKKETVRDFLKGLNERIILLEGAVDRGASLLGVESSLKVQEEDRPARPGMVGPILDSLEGMTSMVNDLLGDVGDILRELERI